MDHITTSHRGRTAPGHALVVALATVLAMAFPAAAQEAGQDPASDPTSGIAFPVTINGQVLDPETYSGTEWLARFSEGDGADPAFVEGTEALIGGVGRSIDDLTVKTALYEPLVVEPDAANGSEVVAEPAVVAALRIEGTDARDWIAEAVDLLVADVIEPGLVMRPLDTKWTLRVTDATMPGVYPRTVYLKADTAWIIQGDTDYVWDALGQLPDADPVGPSSADSLYTDVPLTLGGDRRIGLYESTEPLFLPTLGERLGDALEDWLLDLYLEARIAPSEMIGVISWWGLEAAQDGIQIEGYRLPAGGEALTQRLLDEVFLIRPPEVSVDPDAPGPDEVDEVAAQFEGVSFSEEEIAGQAVTVLDFGGARQYIFSSSDTIWVISDPLGQRELVEEAIAALP